LCRQARFPAASCRFGGSLLAEDLTIGSDNDDGSETHSFYPLSPNNKKNK
jgi:hypothetical protein